MKCIYCFGGKIHFTSVRYMLEYCLSHIGEKDSGVGVEEGCRETALLTLELN